MDKLKQWIAFTVVGVIAVLAAGWFLLVAPKHSKTDELNAAASAQDAANAALRVTLETLKAQAKNEPAQEAKLAAVAAKIPANPDLPTLIRALDKAAASTGVDLMTLSPSAPSAVVAPVAATAAVPVNAPVTTGGAAAPHVVNRAPSTTAGTLAAIPVALTLNGTYFQAIEFIDQLEGFSRAFKVTGLTLAPGDSSVKTSTPGKVLTINITGTVYMAAGRLPVAAVTLPKTGK